MTYSNRTKTRGADWSENRIAAILKQLIALDHILALMKDAEASNKELIEVKEQQKRFHLSLQFLSSQHQYHLSVLERWQKVFKNKFLQAFLNYFYSVFFAERLLREEAHMSDYIDGLNRVQLMYESALNTMAHEEKRLSQSRAAQEASVEQACMEYSIPLSEVEQRYIGYKRQLKSLAGRFESFYSKDFEIRLESGEKLHMVFIRDTWMNTSELDFWDAIYDDIRCARKSILIVSPFIYKNRAPEVVQILKKVDKSVAIRVHTKEVTSKLYADSEKLEFAKGIVEDLSEFATVSFDELCHEKIAIIDEKIVWQGSLNILSHNGTRENMRRLEGREVADEVLRSLRI